MDSVQVSLAKKLAQKAAEKNEHFLNVPNILTLARIVLLPFLILALFKLDDWGKIPPIVTGALMLTSDLIDGPVGRRLNQTTFYGCLLDALTDKLIISSLGITLFFMGYLPVYFVALLVARDVIFIIMGIKLIKRFGFILHTDILGRTTPLAWGLCYILYIAGFGRPAWIVALISVCLTLASSATYLNRLLKVMKRSTS